MYTSTHYILNTQTVGFIIAVLCLAAVLISAWYVLMTLSQLKKETEPDGDSQSIRGGWYFGRIKKVEARADRKVLTFEDGKIISIRAEDPFADGCMGGELVRLYFGCPTVCEQIECEN